MLNTNSNFPLFQYHQQNFTCDNCQQEFQNSSLYSPASDEKVLNQHQTYCPNCVESAKPISLPVKKVKKTKSPKNPLAYYQCMKECCQRGLQGRKITEVAHDCRVN